MRVRICCGRGVLVWCDGAVVFGGGLLGEPEVKGECEGGYVYVYVVG